MSQLVSVVIPLYNSAAWIEETLASIVRQAYPVADIELVLVDDVSQDNSVEVARAFVAEHSLRAQIVVRERNGGPAATRNVGWRLATGDWVQFVDADDLLAPEKLAHQLAFALSLPEDVGVVYSKWQRFGLLDGSWQTTGAVMKPMVDDDPVVQILEDVWFGYVGPTLIRRSWLARVGGFGEQPNLGEDVDLMLRLAKAGAQFRYLDSDRPFFFYRDTPNSAWRLFIQNVEAMRNFLGIWTATETFLRQRDGDQLSLQVRTALARRYARTIDFYQERDPDTFLAIVARLRALGVQYPPDMSQGMKVVSMTLGYHNALRVRSAVRQRLKKAS
jgi:glycosyltransferase involved in cell wall biosynthesis